MLFYQLTCDKNCRKVTKIV